MNGKLTKIGVGLAGAASLLYTLAAPALALDLCGGLSGIGVTTTTSLCSITVSGLVTSAINAILFVAFVAALIFLIIGGVRWTISGGDKEGTTKAKETVTSALIGLAIVLGSWVLINILLNFFGISAGLSGLKPPTLQPGTTTTQ